MTVGTPTRSQKRWSGRLRTAGALMLLAAAVGLVDRLLPRAHDPVLGENAVAIVLPLVLLVAGAVSFWLGRHWR